MSRAVTAPVFLAPGPESIAAPLGTEFGAIYTITGPDGTRAVLNNPLDRDFVGYLIGDDAVTGLERAGVRESSDTLPEADGGIHGIFRYDRLSFTLKGLVDTYTDPALSAIRQAKLLRATDAMGADSTLAWAPTTTPPVMVSFRQAQPTRITGRRPKAFMVAGVAEDPLIYSQAYQLAQVAPSSQAVGGFSSPLRSPLSSNAGIAGQLFVTNAGTRPTWPVITVYGPAVNPVITNFTTGKSLTLNYTLLAGEYLAIDTNPRLRRITLNGTANRYSALDFARSTWWALAAGLNDVRLSFSSYSAGAALTLQWRDAWG